MDLTTLFIYLSKTNTAAGGAAGGPPSSACSKAKPSDGGAEPRQDPRPVNSRGFGLVEIIVVAAIVGTAFVSLYELFVLSSRPISTSKNQTEAVYLMEEAIEAVRVLRNNSWTDNIATLENGTTYYPTVANDQWTLSTINPGPVNGLYTRTIVVNATLRDANDNISSSGTLDPNTKKLTATVTWPERGELRTVTVETYITNYLDN